MSMNIKGSIEVSGKFDKDDLIEYLSKLPGDWNVVYSSDCIILNCIQTILN